MAAKFKREFKNVVYNYTDAEVKVREATSNDPWGPSSTLMRELAEYTFHIEAYTLVMGMLWKRLNDHGKNWRHVYKALVVLEYLVKAGSQRVVAQCKDNIFSVETLKDFQFIDKDGKDQGSAVRDKARELVSLLKDDDLLQDERQKATQSRERQTIPGFGSDSPQLREERRKKKSPRPSPTPERAEGGKVHFEPHMEQARPSANDEEEMQLQLALKMSKEQADEDEKLRIQEEESLRVALELSKQEENAGSNEEKAEEAKSSADLLLDIPDPWATGPSEPPPSYDIVTGSPKADPWADAFGDSTATTSLGTTERVDPFAAGGADPFAVGVTANPPAAADPFQPFKTDPWNMPSSSITANSLPPSSSIAPSTSPFELPPMNPALQPLPVSSSMDPAPPPTNTNQKSVEKSFLGENANLVNLDSLMAALPPPTLAPTSSLNPFATPSLSSTATPPLGRAQNPFEVNKPPAPSINQLRGGATEGFDILPPPMAPISGTNNSESFNPFS